MRDFKIAVIDSGIRIDHPVLNKKKINGYKIRKTSNGLLYADKYEKDNWGHGTAVTSIICKGLPDVTVDVYSVVEENSFIETTEIINVLEYLVKHNNKTYDLVNMSIGSYYDNDEMRNLCFNLHKQGSIIVSAFDNAGAISFPAAYDFVIGVDSSNECAHNDDYLFCKNSMINVFGKGGVQRLAWNSPDYVINQGASFAAAHITNFIARKLISSPDIESVEEILEQNALRIINEQSKGDQLVFNEKLYSNILLKNVALYPFNKEMHSLVNMNEKLQFTIKYIIGTHYTMQRSYTDIKGRMHSICRINECKWDEIDTLIVGHIDDLEQRIGENEFNEVINKCVTNDIQIYAFDNYVASRVKKKVGHKAKVLVPNYNVNLMQSKDRLYKLVTPVIAILGTTSQQGKFHEFLELSHYFKKEHYEVAMLGTEPTSLLFGADEIYPYGYNTSINLDTVDQIRVLNHIMHKLDKLDRDIIICSGQSGTCPMLYNNLNQLNIMGYSFLLGTMPDAVILCVNAFDDIEYIRRSIQYIEGLADTKVVALCLYPLEYKNGWYITNGIKSRLRTEKIKQTIASMENEFDLPVVVNGDENDLSKLFKICVDFFTKE